MKKRIKLPSGKVITVEYREQPRYPLDIPMAWWATIWQIRRLPETRR